ncbi:cysteine desulfurase [Candidatus Bathyarchaeota archaeon]|nr:cysteine desulfurase [Candidatus Bathyarchaeota archaeon]
MDHVAGKPIDPRVTEAMIPYMKSFYGNAGSIHSYGRRPREAIGEARSKVARLVKAERKETITFTSGATESNNMAIKGAANRNAHRGKHLITTRIEHMSVLNPFKYLKTKGFEVTFLPVDKYGTVDIMSLHESLTEKTTLVSVAYANDEIGTIQPIKEISKLVHSKGALLHVNATVANGQVPIDVKEDGIDLLTLSSNDMYGPKGVGALYVRDGVRIEPLIHGGGQEKGLRSGSENVPGIMGFGKAAELANIEMKNENSRLIILRDKLIKDILTSVPYSFLNGHPTKRLPDNVAVRFSFIEGEAILLSLDSMGIAASSGSACTAKTLQPSHVLLATGLKPEEAHGSLLLTMGKQNTEEEATYIIEVIPSIVKRLRAMSPLTPKELRE